MTSDSLAEVLGLWETELPDTMEHPSNSLAAAVNHEPPGAMVLVAAPEQHLEVAFAGSLGFVAEALTL